MWLRRWHFHAYFVGDTHLDVGDMLAKEVVIARIEAKYPGGNWKRDSLERGKRIKIPKKLRNKEHK